MPFHDWEKTPNFDPAKISVNSPRWVNYKGSLLTKAQEMADDAHISQDFISSVIAGEAFADASLLAFRDSSSFRAGELHRHLDQWDKLFQSSDNNFSEVLDWIHNFIHVDKFFTHYKGSYKGVNYNCERPPARIFANHPSCKAFAQFISDTLIERLASGAISLWGKVGECPPPHLVMPLTALSSESIDLVTLQRLGGKCISMVLAVPGARLYTNEINLALSRAVRSSRPVKLSGPLRQELEHWLFLETWNGFLPWRSEKHCHFRLFSDSSSFAWGGVLSPGAITVSTFDYWDSSVIGADIATKETLALNNALQSFGNTVRNSWVDAFVDSQVLLHSWNRRGSRSHSLAGRSGEWNSMLGFGNPAASSPVQGYLKAVSEEQLRAHIVPKQAVPFFLPKLLLLARLWDRKMADPAVSPSALFILARDQAFFKTLFFSADRGSDLGCVKTAEIMRFPKDDGFLFNHVWGKTLRDGAYNVFGIRRHSNPQLCPVKAIETYVAVTSELRITLSNGYLFRPTNHQGHIVNMPLTSSSAEARLKYYLKDAKIDEGETLHGFRSGSAITLALSGSQLADVMSHVGWSNMGTALYYMKLAEVLREGSPSDLLSSNELAASASTTLYADLNRLKDFVSAFPRS
ncbi:unnamed protein product [Porites lobata]|uniref:Tyr recombinase domain-containing protein n=1 Tax=Porites lobata TaxID=104759 RepID=A0ABN8Q4G1_9CNID|nr:unnamed protein product [Porites lobata]